MSRLKYIFILILALCTLGVSQETAKYPSSIVTQSDLLVWKNKKPSATVPKLASDITSGSTTISLTSGTGTQFPAADFTISIDDEIIRISSRTGDTLTVATSGRGYEGTTAASHLASSNVAAAITAKSHNQLIAEVIALESTLGIGFNPSNYATVTSLSNYATVASLSSYATTSAMTTALAAKQNTLSNASTLAKIGESGGNPQWNGGEWPGGVGGGTNATQIQGKSIAAPTVAGTQPIYNGTDISWLSKKDIEARVDIPGMDCTGATPVDTVLSTFTSTTDAITNKTITFKGCQYVRLDGTWLIQKSSGWTIDTTGTTFFGCNGSAVPLIMVQRSGFWTFDADTTNAGKIFTNGGGLCPVGHPGLFTGGIIAANDPAVGGYTNTKGTVKHQSIVPSSGATPPAGWVGIGTTAEQNLENFTIEQNYIDCKNSQSNSRGVDIAAGTAQNWKVKYNDIERCQFGVFTRATQTFIEENLAGGNGDPATFSPVTLNGASTYGAFIGCWSDLNVIKGNSPSEGSGSFLWGGSSGLVCGGTLEENLISCDWASGPGHCSSTQYLVDHFYGVLKNNKVVTRVNGGGYNTRPAFGSSPDGADGVGGANLGIVDLGNKLDGIMFESLLPRGGVFMIPAISVGSGTPKGPIENTFGEVFDTFQYEYGANAVPSAPVTFRSRASTASATPTRDDFTIQNVSTKSGQTASALAIAHTYSDYATQTGLLVPDSFVGGIQTFATPALQNASASAMGGGSGTTWGYKADCVSGASLHSVTSELTVSSAYNLTNTTFNRVQFRATPWCSTVNIYRTTAGGNCNGVSCTNGKIASWTLPANMGCSLDVNQGCNSTGYTYFFDKGQVGDGTSAPTTNADGSISVPSGACYKVNGVCQTTPSTKTAATNKWLASFDATTGLFTQTQPDYSNLTGTPTLGTASALNVPSTGNAASGEVVKGSDTRLSDARTPTTHTHAESDVTNLATDLANALTRTCAIILGDESGNALITGNIQPQKSQCFADRALTVKQILVKVDAGASTVQLGYRHSTGGSPTTTAYTASALTPATVTNITDKVVCANAAGTAITVDGVSVTCSTLATQTWNSGDSIETIGGAADGTTKRMSIFVTVN